MPSPRFDAGLLAAQAGLALALVGAYANGAKTNLPSPARDVLALALVLTAALVAGAALIALWPSFRVAPTPKHDAVLIQHGVYRRLRHPMYTSVLLLLTAMSLHQPSVAVLLVAGLNATFYLAKARYEESLLLAHYPGYAAYRAKTWGVVPGF